MRQDATLDLDMSALPDETREFMAGGLRDRLGLEPGTLAIGRVIAEGHLRAGALHQALKLYGALALCEPANADVQLGIAECAARLEDYGMGVAAATLATTFAPESARAQALLGRCRMALGDRDRARQAFEAAAALGLERRDARVVQVARQMLSVLAAAGAEPDRATA